VPEPSSIAAAPVAKPGRAAVRAPRRGWLRRQFAVRRLYAALAGILAVVLAAVVAFFAQAAWPAIRFNGWHFFTRDTWDVGSQYANPILRHGQMVLPGAHYGIVFLIAGTLLSTLIAVVLAVPAGVLAAIFLAECIPAALRTGVSFFVELLAAIPSVVFGLWGYVFLIPFLSRHVFPWMAAHLGRVPFFGGATGSGYGLLTAGVVLALMIVPLVTATVRDALLAQPHRLRDAALALGATRFETLWMVQLPGTRRALTGSAILATGRALGETMAVLMISGNALNYLPNNIYSPISTMASFIVSQLDGALQDPTGMAVHALAEVALALCLISVVVNGIARALLYWQDRVTLAWPA
jgi:phosphate transport system permease protein